MSGYRVYRGGSQIGTTAAPAYMDAAAPAGATAVYTVRAYDAAGNLGAASARTRS